MSGFRRRFDADDAWFTVAFRRQLLGRSSRSSHHASISSSVRPLPRWTLTDSRIRSSGTSSSHRKRRKNRIISSSQLTKRERVARLRTFRPVEHAAGLVQRLVDAGDHAAELLRVDPRLACQAAAGDVPGTLPIRQRVEAAALLSRQRDVADPQAGGGLRDADLAGDRGQRATFAPKLAGAFAATERIPEHEHMFVLRPDGSNPGLYPQRESNSRYGRERAAC